MHSWIKVDSVNSLDELLTLVDDPDFAVHDVVELLKSSLSLESVKGILVETKYIDKDYRSTYYNFYAKKGLRYGLFCVRLHFFLEGVELRNQSELVWPKGPLHQYYVGYMVLRPTPTAPIGRTVLSPAARNGVRGGVITADHHVHVLGQRIEVKGFPYMQQHTDISVCAHAVCWSILRHLSQKHRCYAEFLLTDITEMASQTEMGGLLPSRGLNLDQVARIFSLAKLFPDTTYRRDVVDENKKRDPARFYRQINAYVESGLPVFAELCHKPHAVALVGQGPIDRTAFGDKDSGVLFEWDAISSLIVVDDNFMPYKTIDTISSEDYRVTDIGAFVVPLPEKIYLPAESAEAQILQVLDNGYLVQSDQAESDDPNASEPKRINLDFQYIVRPVVRYFLTTSARFREFAEKEKSAYPDELFRTIMDLPMPQFIWLAEIASLQDWQQKRATVMFVMDATASAYDDDPFFIVHDNQRAAIHDRGDTRKRGFITFPHSVDGMPSFRLNLLNRS